MNDFKNKYEQKIKENIKIEFKNTFSSMNNTDRDLLGKYLYYLISISSEYFTITQTIDEFYYKITENNFQDMYSFLILLMPYFNLNKASKVNSLNEILFDKENTSSEDILLKKSICKKIETSYYVDHNIDDLTKYFDEMLLIINDSLSKVSFKLCPNWLNIQPVTLQIESNKEYYLKSPYYLNFKKLYLGKKLSNSLKKFWNEDKMNKSLLQKEQGFDDRFYLGNSVLYGTVTNFLYRDIKDIKWMIYDYSNNNKTFPTIIMMRPEIPLVDMSKIPWDRMDKRTKDVLEESWKNIQQRLKSSNYYNTFRLFKPLILFYLRSIKNNKKKIKKLRITEKCLKILFGDNFENDLEEEEEIDKKIYSRTDRDVDQCLLNNLSKITCEEISKYIFESVQKFRYTWYGYMCTSSNGQILNEQNYNAKFQQIFGTTCEIRKNNKLEGYVTLKIFYNFFKLLTLNNFSSNNFKNLSESGEWDSLINENKDLFIKKMNRTDLESWFNIKNTLKIVYGSTKDINFLHTKVIEKFNNENYIPIIVTITLVINGMLSHIKYNKMLTNNNFIPDKSRHKDKWKKHMLSNINIDPHAHSFLSNMELEETTNDDRWKKYISGNKIMEKKTFNGIDIIKDSLWSEYFGSNWIAQVQVYTHFINQRVIFITGATGAGKSTIVPLLLLYAEKSIHFNNNAKLYCSQPRIQPTKDNANRMASAMGYPIIEEETPLDKSFDEDIQLTQTFGNMKSNKSVLPINYIQYKYKDHDVEDNYYHPTLRLYTDGTLYNDVKTKYLLKEQLDQDDIYSFGKKNICDILLVDESHEHNTYMDMILTLVRFSIYVNNSVTLGIVSATMENDEEKYREYYSLINDNWKYPLDVRYLYKNEKIDKMYLDRRVHVSPPFAGTNYKVTEITKYKLEKIEEQDINKINNRVLDILNIILGQTSKGDILIFLPGQNDIKTLKKIINDNTDNETLAIPFYKDFDKKTLDNVVKKIADENVRKSIINPKHIEIDIELDDKKQTVPEGTYKRFIILATNIAEASITINTLTNVIDTGTEKIKKYDYITKEEKLVKELISLPSKTQRKGRVGRVQPGIVYYTYDASNLRETVVYKICIDNISEHIIKLLTEETEHLINENNDPYFVEESKINKTLYDQYIYINSDGNNIKFNNEFVEKTRIKMYPYKDGKYNLETLKDIKYQFYLVHPNELDKDMPNKIELIADHYKSKNYISVDNKLTVLGTKVVAYSEYFEFQTELSNILIDLIENWKMLSSVEFLEKIIAFIIIKSSGVKIKQYMNGSFVKAGTDFLKYLYTAKETYAILRNKTVFQNKKEQDELNNLVKFLDKLEEVKETILNIKLSLIRRNNIDYLKNSNNKEELEEEEKKIEEEEKGKYYKKNYKQFVDKISKLKPTNILSNEIFLMNEYEQLCFLVIKNVPNNLYIKILGTIYYINYINRNVNSIYAMECIGRKILTTIPSSYINYIIYALKADDTILSNIMWIPKIVIDKVNKYNKNILQITKINKIDIEYCKNKYDNKFNIIYENLSEIQKSLIYK